MCVAVHEASDPHVDQDPFGIHRVDHPQRVVEALPTTESAAFVQLQTNSGRVAYGCGIDSSIEKSGIMALVSAFNRTRT